jgi:nucleotide-binding universal stress UspA family protein
MKILCAIDDSESSKPAIALAGQTARAFHANLTLLVVNSLLGGHGRVGAELMWEKGELDMMLASAQADIIFHGGPVAETVVISGIEPADAIVNYAKANNCELIVLGTGGKGTMARMVLGSISSKVLVRAHSSVTIAR